jgi:PA14 domain
VAAVEKLAEGDVGQRRSGSVRPPTEGLYTFSLTGDATNLWVDGVKVIEAWGDTSVPRFGKLVLEAGVDLDVLLEVRAPSNGANVRLSWEGPGIDRQPISNAVLRPTRGRQARLPIDAPLKDIARARGLLIGAAVQAEPLLTNPRYRALSAEQFSLAPAEADFVFNAQNPQDRDNFPTEGIDSILSVTGPAGQESQAFHLLWPEFVSINP